MTSPGSSRSRFRGFAPSGFVLSLVLGFVATALPVRAEAAGSTGATFLELGIGPRAAALGNAYTAIADDVYGMYFNPAGIATVNRQEIGFAHNTLILDLDYNYLAYAYPMRGGGTLALSGIYVDLGVVDRREVGAGGASTASLGSASGYDFSFSASYARTLSRFVDLGATVKVINETLDNYSANAIAIDLGAKWRPPVPGLTLGVSISNLGSSLKFVRSNDELPITLRLGAAYKTPNKRFGLSGDLVYTKNQDMEGGVGAEFWVWPEHIVLRGGANSQNDAGSGASIGAGFHWNDVAVDYAYVPFGDLGDQNLISVGYKFGPTRPPAFEPAAPSTSRAATTAPSTAPTAARTEPTRFMPRFGIEARDFAYRVGPQENDWVGAATAEVLRKNWERSALRAETFNTALYRIEGEYWVIGTNLIVSASITPPTGEAAIVSASGDVGMPFAVWQALEYEINARLAAWGVPVTVTPVRSSRPAPQSAPQAAAVPQPVQTEPVYVPASSTTAPVTQPAPSYAPPPAPPVLQAPVVSVSRILEYGATVESDRSRGLTAAIENALRTTGVQTGLAAPYRFDASFSDLIDGRVVVYGRLVDRATGIPIGTIEVYGSPSNPDALAARVADAILFKLPR
jgi:hypothetical protein